MQQSLAGAFRHKEIKDVRILVREASFYLGTLKTEIRVRLYVTPDDEETVHFERCHHLQTPLSSQRSTAGSSSAFSEAEAFEEVVQDLTDAYEVAVMAGHRPQEDWLVPNEHF